MYLIFKLEQQLSENLAKNFQADYNKEKLANYQQVLYSLLDLVEKRDSYTAGHTQRVARYAVMIAEAMKLPKEKIDLLYETAIMHDIGKVVTPDAVLLKPGKLSPNEYKVIQGHLSSGYDILNSIKAFKPHAEIMRDHHERYDGKGYPRGLKGSDISILSHILIIADDLQSYLSSSKKFASGLKRNL